MTKKVFDGFTKRQLDSAFDLIKFPSGIGEILFKQGF